MQKSDCMYYRCFTKNRDGSNRLIEKVACFLQTIHFGSILKTFLTVLGPNHKKKIKIQLKKVNIIDILDKKISAIFGDGQKRTNQKYAYGRRCRKRPEIEMLM